MENKKCECTTNNEKIVIDEVNCTKLSSLFKVFGDLTRIKILSVLSEKELSVCDISSSLNISHSLTSHQLQVLKKNKLVKFRREGKVIYYSLDDNHVELIIKMGMEHINEEK